MRGWDPSSALGRAAVTVAIAALACALPPPASAEDAAPGSLPVSARIRVAVTIAVNAAGVTYDAGLLAQPFPLHLELVPRTWGMAAAFLAARPPGATAAPPGTPRMRRHAAARLG